MRCSEDAGSRAARAVAPRGGFRAAGRSRKAMSLASLAGGQAGQRRNRLTGKQVLMHSLRASRAGSGQPARARAGTSAPATRPLCASPPGKPAVIRSGFLALGRDRRPEGACPARQGIRHHPRADRPGRVRRRGHHHRRVLPQRRVRLRHLTARLPGPANRLPSGAQARQDDRRLGPPSSAWRWPSPWCWPRGGERAGSPSCSASCSPS